MKNIFYVLFFLVYTGFIFSCKKEVAKVNKDFIGEWGASDGNNDAHLIVDDNSDGTLFLIFRSNSTKVEGKTRIKNNILKIGLRKFKINMMPKKIDYSQLQDSIVVPIPYHTEYATWEMELESTSKFHIQAKWRFYR